MPTTYPATADRADVVEVLIRALDREDEPLSALQIRRKLSGPYKLKPEQLGQILEEEVDSGKIHRFSPYRSKSPRYWTRDPDQYARAMILKMLGKRPQPQNELLSGLKASLRGYSEDRLRQSIQALKTEGQIRELPHFVRSRAARRLSLQPPDPREYLRDAIDWIAKELKGVTHPQLLEATIALMREGSAEHAPLRDQGGPVPSTRTVPSPLPESPPLSPTPADLEGLILEQMTELEPAALNGALISLRDLRRSLEFKDIDKAAFEATVLRLAEQGRVSLHRDDHPEALTQEQRDERVRDDRGNYYVGIARRI
jgi:hypothetical protein